MAQDFFKPSANQQYKDYQNTSGDTTTSFKDWFNKAVDEGTFAKVGDTLRGILGKDTEQTEQVKIGAATLPPAEVKIFGMNKGVAIGVGLGLGLLVGVGIYFLVKKK